MNRQRKTKAAYTLPIFAPGMPLHSVTVTLSLTNGGTTAIKHTLRVCLIGVEPPLANEKVTVMECRGIARGETSNVYAAFVLHC